MFRPIYSPRGRAQEYCDLAINTYTGCNHGCIYCYAREYFKRYHLNENFSDVKMRNDIAEATRKQLETGKYKEKTINLCFMCDPYPAPPVDSTSTREVIETIKEAGAHVQILTKGGLRAQRDFDLLDQYDSFGVTYSGYEDGSGLLVCEREPNAAVPFERLAVLEVAHQHGIKTWISCEPVYVVEDIYRLIKCTDYIDLYKIGKLNHMPSDINWARFGRECERLCKQFERGYYIKEDLRKEMEASVTHV